MPSLQTVESKSAQKKKKKEKRGEKGGGSSSRESFIPQETGRATAREGVHRTVKHPQNGLEGGRES